MSIGIVFICLKIAVILGLDDISVRKNATQNSTEKCIPPSVCEANNAVDRNINTCSKTTPIGRTSTKSTWWYVDLGEILSVFDIRIQFKDNGPDLIMRQRGRFAGFSVFVSNTTDRNQGFLCYKNGLQLPPLDFTISCITHGRFVIYYNERLDGTNYPTGYEINNVYTELCELTARGCSKRGVYGNSCNESCPENCQEQRCDITNGSCLGCTPGWIGEYCNKECEDGFYGLECSTECKGYCKNGPCNHTTGNCDKGCTDGWTGDHCDTECRGDTYGQECKHNCSGHCNNDVPCNRTNGFCNEGCQPGYTGEKCDQGCENGTFGANCRDQCSLYCLPTGTCNSLNGFCFDGCAPGYFGNLCNNTCKKGRYGMNCTEHCFTNCQNDVCNHVDGTCPCKSGWKGFNCSEANQLMGAESSVNVAVLSAGSSAGVVVIAVLIGGILIFRWRKNVKSNATSETEIYGLSSVEDASIKRNTKGNDTSGIQNSAFQEDKENLVTKHKTPLKDRMYLDRLTEYLSAIKQPKMDEEYKIIPRGELHPCTEGKKQENLSKNRYTTIFPYDHSRVVLHTSSGESDYINANYIEDIRGKRAYIASQGPKKNTINDFWLMVWQENARVIVCLTNVKENKSNKCAQYWPNLNDKIKNGDIIVRCQQEKIYAEHIIRHLHLQNAVNETERDVFMFHYTEWPDHGVPEPLSLMVFHRRVMKTVEEHPWGHIIVHCSAGVGRTGTFIALDALYKEGERTGDVDVPKYVETMRNSRMNMIQGEDQYSTLYMALLESFRGYSKDIPVEKFLQEYQDHYSYNNIGDVVKKSALAVEFKELQSMKRNYTQEDYKSGKLNITANYVSNVLPVERYLCPLTNTKAKNVYYNAVSVQSYTKSDLFLSAQYPLPDYTEDFLRLVKAYYAPTVVSLQPLADVESTVQWLPTKNEMKTIGDFTTKMSACSQTDTMAKTNITLHHKGGSSMCVTLLECRRWTDGDDVRNRRILIDLIKEAKIEENSHPSGRILVLSSDGAIRCGPFCAVFNALEQMTIDSEVDLFTITRQLQTRRPEFMSSLEEYKMCYDTVADYLQNDSVYANF
ncbi:receptor-type tyrosine-protein phosphatase epsilon-like [Crassostrea virginica]